MFCECVLKVHLLFQANSFLKQFLIIAILHMTYHLKDIINQLYPLQFKMPFLINLIQSDILFQIFYNLFKALLNFTTFLDKINIIFLHSQNFYNNFKLDCITMILFLSRFPKGIYLLLFTNILKVIYYILIKFTSV